MKKRLFIIGALEIFFVVCNIYNYYYEKIFYYYLLPVNDYIYGYLTEPFRYFFIAFIMTAPFLLILELFVTLRKKKLLKIIFFILLLIYIISLLALGSSIIFRYNIYMRIICSVLAIIFAMIIFTKERV